MSNISDNSEIQMLFQSMGIPDLPLGIHGQLSISTNLVSGKSDLVLSFDFIKNVSDADLVSIIRWMVEHPYEFGAFCQKVSDPESGLVTPIEGTSNTKLAQPENTWRHDRHGYVYLLRCGDVYKIGCAQDLTPRISQIKPCLPYPVDLIHSIQSDDMFQLEKELHERFADQRLQGEWFRLSDIAIEFIKNI